MQLFKAQASRRVLKKVAWLVVLNNFVMTNR